VSVPRSAREQIADQGHEADNETDIHDRGHKQQSIVDTRDDEIELKELKDDHRKVNKPFPHPLRTFNISQGDDLRTS
jgi:hypothetical protein